MIDNISITLRVAKAISTNQFLLKKAKRYMVNRYKIVIFLNSVDIFNIIFRYKYYKIFNLKWINYYH